jgi:hypothetical protein
MGGNPLGDAISGGGSYDGPDLSLDPGQFQGTGRYAGNDAQQARAGREAQAKEDFVGPPKPNYKQRQQAQAQTPPDPAAPADPVPPRAEGSTLAERRGLPDDDTSNGGG